MLFSSFVLLRPSDRSHRDDEHTLYLNVVVFYSSFVGSFTMCARGVSFVGFYFCQVLRQGRLPVHFHGLVWGWKELGRLFEGHHIQVSTRQTRGLVKEDDTCWRVVISRPCGLYGYVMVRLFDRRDCV